MNFLLFCDLYSDFGLTVSSFVTFAAPAISAGFASIAVFSSSDLNVLCCIWVRIAELACFLQFREDSP